MKYRAGYKYQLVDGERFHTQIRPPERIDTTFLNLHPSGRLLVLPGYAWDGPSGPTWDTKNSLRGSLAHDALYQLIRQGYLPFETWKQADVELDKVLKEDGMWWPRRAYWMAGLKLAGGSAAKPSNAKKVLTAP